MRKFIIYMFIAGLVACESKKSIEVKGQEENVRMPNIVFILADDLGYGDLSSFGQEKFSTPNIDKLAASGMVFTQHYSGSTVCAPSRSVLLTGFHTGHTPVRGNKEVRPEGQYPLPDSSFTLAEFLKEAGYATGAFGKWGLGSPGSPGDPLNQGFDTFFGYNCQRFAHNYYPRHLWSNADSVVIEENKENNKGLYAPELIHEKTLQFIDDNKEKPFFLFVPAVMPHAELAAPEKNFKKYDGKFSETPFEGYDEGENYRQGPYESQEKPHAAFAAMVDLLDEQVGDIVQKIEDLGLMENTIIIFTSDNGPHEEAGGDPEFFNSNGPLKGVKRDLYEGGIRVPMMVSWKGKIKEGSNTNHISAFWDIFPTIADFINKPVQENFDGISFYPTLTGNSEAQKSHKYLYWEFHERGGRVAVRMGDWKGVRYDVFKNPDAPLELYNLAKDIGEENNVADQHPDIVSHIETILDTARVHSEVFTFEGKK